jgi:hypothetical protein
VDYSARTGKRFKPLGWFGPKRAQKILRGAREEYVRSRNGGAARAFTDYVKALRA